MSVDNALSGRRCLGAASVKGQHLCVRKNTAIRTETVSQYQTWRTLRQEADPKWALLHRTTTLWIIGANAPKFWATAQKNKTSESCGSLEQMHWNSGRMQRDTAHVSVQCDNTPNLLRTQSLPSKFFSILSPPITVPSAVCRSQSPPLALS